MNLQTKSVVKKLIDCLNYIYITQKIHEYGVINKNIPKSTLNLLEKLEFVRDSKWSALRGHYASYHLTEKGDSVARIIVNHNIFQLKANDFAGLNLNAILYLLDKKKMELFFDKKRIVEKESGRLELHQISENFFIDCKNVMKFFKEKQLAGIADNYVSTDGGKLIDKYYLLAENLNLENLSEIINLEGYSKKLQTSRNILIQLNECSIKYNAVENLTHAFEKNWTMRVERDKETQEYLIKVMHELEKEGLIYIKDEVKTGNLSPDPIFVIDRIAFESKIRQLLQSMSDEIQEKVVSIDKQLIDIPIAEISSVSSDQNSKNAQMDSIDIPSVEEIIDKTKLNVFLGKTETGNDVFWTPGNLDNGHLIILGGAGAGKTVTIRCISYEMTKSGYPVLLIDFHGDMGFKNKALRTYEINENSDSYFNPLELNSKFPDTTPLRATSDFIDAMSINFTSIGKQQREQITNLILANFKKNGITHDQTTWINEIQFDEIQDSLFQNDDKISVSLRAYFGDIFRFKLFKGTRKISINDILNGGITHINLKGLPENLRSFYADLLLRKLYYSLQSLGEIKRNETSDKEKFRIFVIIDEAKLLVNEKNGIKAVLNKYATELRKFGVGVIMSMSVYFSPVSSV